MSISQAGPDEKPRFFLASVEEGYDSNVSGLNTDLLDVDDVWTTNLMLGGEYGWRWKRTNDRVFDIALGGSLWLNEHKESDYTGESTQLNGRVEYDLPVEPKKVKKLTVAAQVAGWQSYRNNKRSVDSLTVTAGIQVTFDTFQECNLDNVLVYYEREDFTDQTVSDAALTRDGTNTSAGFEFTLYPGHHDNKKVKCRRLGIFRRYASNHTWVVSAGYRHDDVGAAREYAALWDQLYVDTTIPLRYKTSLALSANFAEVEYRNNSVYPPFIARKDNPWQYQVSLVWYFDRFDIQAGYRYETNTSSDVGLYAYRRDYFFVGLNLELYAPLDDGPFGAAGSTSDSRGGQSGSSDPVNPQPTGGT